MEDTIGSFDCLSFSLLCDDSIPRMDHDVYPPPCRKLVALPTRP